MADVNPQAQSMLTEAFGADVSNAIVVVAGRSTLLTDVLNSFAAPGSGRTIVLGNGPGTYASSDGRTVTIDPTKVPNTLGTGLLQTEFAKLLGHEMGHCVVPGGVGLGAYNPDEAG